MAERLAAKLALNGLDLNMLPPAESLAGLVGGRDLALDLALSNARFRNAPAGSASLDLRRDGAVWRLSRLAIEASAASRSRARARCWPRAARSRAHPSPRFETLAALAGPLLPDVARQALARAGDGLSGWMRAFA